LVTAIPSNTSGKKNILTTTVILILLKSHFIYCHTRTFNNLKQVGAQAQNATNAITLTGRRLFFICSEHYLKLFLLVTLENDEYTSGWHALEYMHIINIFSATAFT